MTARTERRLSLGASVEGDGVRFRVWAPKARRVEVQLERADGAPRYDLLTATADGLHEGLIPGIGAGARYQYRLDGERAYPDPCSRFQPEGVHGPSEVIDPSRFRWHDDAWPEISADGLIIYECHVGTMTPEGTFAALTGQLPELKRLGITAVELLPVAAFPGRWNWGYDGVDLYAPSHHYGHPDDLRRLVDAAHRVGLGVIMDVVYNHLGPDGNYLGAYSDAYFTSRHQTPWGDAINYDGPGSRWVREYVIQNACHWIAEYHLDGLRFDATHAIVDDSPRHLLAELAERARAVTSRRIVLIAEDDRREVRLIRPQAEGGYGLDGVWADDFHHALRVLLTNEREGYFEDFTGTPAEIARAVNDGFIFQGQPSARLGKARGTTVTDEPARAFVFCIQNHDQIGNRATGDRLNHAIAPAAFAVASTALLLAPETPLLFMGQEFAASTPFLFFTDHHPELGRLVTAGRRQEFQGFAAFRDPAFREQIPDPQAEETFLRSKLDLSERRTHASTYRLYRDLLHLRRTDSVLSVQDRRRTRAMPLGERALTIHRWHDGEHRLVLVNFGPALTVPLVERTARSSLPGGRPRLLLATTRRRYGGTGERVTLSGAGNRLQIHLPAQCAAVLSFSEPASATGDGAEASRSRR